MHEIKLVIWDLDDTFWQGTLSEGPIEKIEKNIFIVKELTDRGIMNSIVSKNDFEAVMKALKQMDRVDEYFIFPHISWSAKGAQVKDLLKECNLRAENTLFIDDNVFNLKEVEFTNPGIICKTPDYLQDILTNPSFKGKDDIAHTRLKQYKVLEEKNIEKNKYDSNEEFLKASHINVKILEDCIEYEDRIYELIQRTNQLNFTKFRQTKDNLHKMILDDKVKCGAVFVADDYGFYGLSGFYAMDDVSVIHFLFSCRVLGMGIEQFVYEKLECPKFDSVGETAVNLRDDAYIDWIIINNDLDIESENIDDGRFQILMVGGCDLEQMCTYLSSKGKFNVKKEFNTVIDGQEYRTSDSFQLVNSLKLSEEQKAELCDNLPFYHKDITFATDFFDPNNKVIVYSVVDDFIRGTYKSKNDRSLYVGYAGYFDQKEWLDKFSENELNYLNENFIFEGKEKKELFESNLRFLIENVSADTKIVLINGVEVNISDKIGKDRVNRNIEMNKVVDKVVSYYRNVYLLDMRDIVTCRADLGNDNRHFYRTTYYKMALRLNEILVSNGFGDGFDNELVRDEEKEKLRIQYEEIKNKNIVIYGTGINAQKLIISLYDFNIVGVLDRDRKNGDFFGYGIVDWDNLEPQDADVLIIAADKRHIDEIKARILPECKKRNISILS
ncbi:MAG: HAD-IIIC family phosphatase [Lachnospiraceae bacterium]|nr:HAD-IIIC family phosphatase [Lachnospiraceae bacterium]